MTDRIELAVKAADLLDGWMYPDELRWLAQRAAACQRVVEIGSFKGRSTKALALACPGRVVGVDPWPWPAVWAEFQRKLGPEIECGKVLSLRSDGRRARQEVRAALGDQPADMVFIDDDHTRETLSAHIKLYRPLLAPGGLLCGHDYENEAFPDVTAVVRELLPEHENPVLFIWSCRI